MTSYSLDTSVGPADVTLTERGTGRPILLLHGGAGPQSVTAFADQLADAEHARVLTPTHPGFGGTPRPDHLNSIADLAAVYAALLADLNLGDVTVIGNSIGGWIAAELALLAPPEVTSIVLVDAVGIEVPGHPVVDFFALTMDEIAQRSYHDPDKFRIDVSALPPAAQAVMAGNRAALAVYGGTAMTDPGLAARLAAVAVPTLVLWGDSDQIADVDYGQAYAAAIPGAEFRVLARTGHVPQLESPDLLEEHLREFAEHHALDGPAR